MIYSIEQVQSLYGDNADVMTVDEFIEAVDSGCFTTYDGWGFFHNGVQAYEERTVWDPSWTPEEIEARGFIYVVWYNR